MKKFNCTIALLCILIGFNACKKDTPIPEKDQEEVGIAKLIFTPVTYEAHGDHGHYHDIPGAKSDTITFSGSSLLPPVGTHLHLHTGSAYRLSLIATDFGGRETQQTFVERDDIHQVFITGAPEGSLNYEYADKKADGKEVHVGVTGYLTVLKPTNSFTLRYVMRHLNPGIKAAVKPTDWNASDFTKFTGDNDLDLKIPLHLVDADSHGH